MRPLKEGLDYFSLDVDMDQDDKVALIEAKHGLTGFALIVKILMKIYKEGYFYPWSEREQLLFSKRVNVDINSIIAIINDAVRWGFFNETLYQTYQILTSSGIQKRYLEASKRRRKITMIQEYLLIDLPESTPNFQTALVSVNNNEINDNKNPTGGVINDSNKYIKQIESKRKESSTPEINVDINEDKEPWVIVQEYWLKMSGCFSLRKDIEELIDLGDGDIELVMKVMKDKFKEFKPQYRGDKIRSVHYFHSAIGEASAAKQRDKPIINEVKAQDLIDHIWEGKADGTC